MLVNAVNSALQDGEVSFNGVGVSRAANVFLGAVANGFVRSEVPTNAAVNIGFVGHEVAGWRGVARDHRMQVFRGDVGDVKRANFAAAFDQREHRHLRAGASKLLARVATDIGFVGFESNLGAAERRNDNAVLFGHGLADTMAKEPRGFHAAIEHPLNLAGRNALLAGAHQVNDLEPQMQRQMRGFEDGSHANGKGLAALVALDETLAGGLALHTAQPLFVGISAMMANRPVRPKTAFEISESGVFVLEVRGVEDRGSHDQIPYGCKTTPWGLVCQV